MKIVITENQHKKLFKEDTESSSVGDLITPKIIKIMRSLNKFYRDTNQTINELTNDWGLSNADATTIVHNYEKIFKNLPDNEYESFLGKPLEFQGNYEISVHLPTIVHARTYLNYIITVQAGSPEDALSNAISLIVDDRFPVEIPETHYNINPDLDWEFDYDTELIRDMAKDTLTDFSDDWDKSQYNQYVKLKK